MLAKDIERAIRCSTPLIAIETPDPASAIKAVLDSHAGIESLKTKSIIFCWDSVRGIRPLTPLAKQSLGKVLPDGIDPSIGNAVAMLSICESSLPENAAMIMLNADAHLSCPVVLQGIWNLRDPFAENMRALVMIGPGFRFPAAVKHDVHILEEPLPGPKELGKIVAEVAKSAGVDLTDEQLDDAKAALQGLSSFSASQVTAISSVGKVLDHDHLWDRKRKAIEQTPGLTVWRGNESFDGIGGVENVKKFLGRVIAGPKRPETIVFIDEIEKALAGSGSGGDSSGVSQGLLQQLLTYMQDQSASGMIFIGPPGTSKSMVAKASGNEAKCDTVCLDLGGMKGSLVGESEQRMRDALKVVTAHSNGKSLWIATCNSIGALPPELRRRFTFGTFFFDLPDATERATIWKIYRTKYKLAAKDVTPDDEGWTGAEIKQCCEVAYAISAPLVEAAKYVVPVSVSARDQIENLRTMASGRFLSASQPGIFQKDADAHEMNGEAKGRRMIRN